MGFEWDCGLAAPAQVSHHGFVEVLFVPLLPPLLPLMLLPLLLLLVRHRPSSLFLQSFLRRRSTAPDPSFPPSSVTVTAGTHLATLGRSEGEPSCSNFQYSLRRTAIIHGYSDMTHWRRLILLSKRRCK